MSWVPEVSDSVSIVDPSSLIVTVKSAVADRTVAMKTIPTRKIVCDQFLETFIMHSSRKRAFL
jgi:hypothetical protein